MLFEATPPLQVEVLASSDSVEASFEESVASGSPTIRKQPAVIEEISVAIAGITMKAAVRWWSVMMAASSFVKVFAAVKANCVPT